MISKSASVKSKAIRSSLWTMGGYGISQVLRFSNNIILARLLTPEIFGLMVLINTFIMGLELFSDIGIGQTLVQNPNGEKSEFYNTAWTVQAIRGICLWLVCLLITVPLASFYDERRLIYLFPLAGFTVVISGFKSPSIPILQKRLMQSRLTILELSVQLVSLISMVVWALISPGVLALIFGNLVGSTFRTFSSHFLLSDVKARFHLNRDVLDEMSSFGRWIFLSSVLLFISQQGDRLFLGKAIPLELLGIYGIARALSNVLRLVLIKLGTNVVFPTASRLADIPRKQLHSKIAPYRLKFILLSSVFCAFLITFSDSIIAFLYDERYQAASWIMPILVIGVWFRCLFETAMPILMGIGSPQYGAYANFFKTIALLFGMTFGLKIVGFVGAVLAISISEMCGYITIQFGLYRSGLLFLKQDILAAMVLVLTGILLSYLRITLGYELPISTFFEML